jgi:hypothetical protein
VAHVRVVNFLLLGDLGEELLEVYLADSRADISLVSLKIAESSHHFFGGRINGLRGLKERLLNFLSNLLCL